MIRLVFAALAAVTLLLVPATAQGDSSVRVRGTVALKNAAHHVVTVRASRQAVALRVPGSLVAIRVGQRVELRGSTLRARGNGSRVLARNVSIASSLPLSASHSPAPPRADDDDEADDDEVEIEGTLTSLGPLTVQSATRTVTCTVPVGLALAGFAVGDFVEITCDLKGSTWVLRELEHEDDDDDDRADRDDDDAGKSGPGGDDDDDDADHGDDHSGPGGGGDDDDDDSSGSGDDDD